MYRCPMPVLLVLCASCASALVQNKGADARNIDVNSDDAHGDVNTDSWDKKSSAAEAEDEASVKDAGAEKDEEEPSAAAVAAFKEPPAVAPRPKTWSELTPEQQQALKTRYVIGQWFSAVCTWVIWTVLGVLVGLFVYTQKTVELDEKVSASDEGGPEYEFNNGHCACLEDIESCACACFCPALRWADTLSQAGFSKFWFGFLLYTFLALLNCIHWGKLWAGLFTAFGVCIMRQRLRAKIGLPSGDVRGCCLDYCFALWCPCCAIAQEARVVQAMQRCGHESLEQESAES